MNELYVARNNEIRDWIIEVIKNQRLPFKILVQPMFPSKTPSQLAYLWGVVYRRIADHTGHTTREVHNGYKDMFNLEYSELPGGSFCLRVKGTSEENTVSLNEYMHKVRADAVIELGINIELPNEVFVNELNYDDYDYFEDEVERDSRVILGQVPKLYFKTRVYKRVKS